MPPQNKEVAALLAAAEGYLREENLGGAYKAAHTASDRCRELGDCDGLADAIRIIVNYYCYLGQHSDAQKLAEEELAKAHSAEHRLAEAKLLLAVTEAKAQQHCNYEEALASASLAQGIFAEEGHKKMEGMALLSIINLHINGRTDKKKRVQEALAAAAKAQSLFRDVGDKRGEAKALHALAATHVCSKKNGIELGGTWEEPAQQALALFKDLDSKHEETFEMICIADWYLKDGRFQRAIKQADEALGICQSFSSGQWQAALSVLVDALLEVKDISDAGKYKAAGQAVRIANDGAEHFREIGDKFGEASALTCLMKACLSRSETDVVLSTSLRASELWQDLGMLDQAGKSLYVSSQMYMRRQEYDMAAQMATRIVETSESARGRISALEMLYRINIINSDFRNALQSASEMQVLLIEEGDRQGEAMSFLLMANVHFMQQDFQEALAVAKEAQDLYRDIGDTVQEMRALRVVAEVHAANHDPFAALEAAKSAREYANKLGKKEEEADAVHLVAQIHVQLLISGVITDIDEAWLSAAKAAREAVTFAHQVGKPALAASSLCIVAQVQMLNKNFQVALSAAQEATNIFRQRKDDLNIAHAILVEANVHMNNNNPPKAAKLIKDGLTLFQKSNDAHGESLAWSLLEQIEGPQVPQEEAMEQQQEQVALQEQQPVAQAQTKAGRTKALPTESLELSTASVEMLRARIETHVRNVVELDDDEEIEIDQPLMQVGVSSRTAVALRNSLVSDVPGAPLPATLIFDYPSISAIAELIMDALPALQRQ